MTKKTLQLGMIGQIRRGERLERDVGLPANAVAALEDPAALARFDILGLLLVGRLGRVPVPRPFTRKS